MAQKLGSLRKLLGRAEKRYTAAIGLRDESMWKSRVKQLTTQVELLEWVLKEEPAPAPAPEQQRDVEEYGALCNPKRFGE